MNIAYNPWRGLTRDLVIHRESKGHSDTLIAIIIHWHPNYLILYVHP